MSERRYFSGNSVEQAVMNAARHFKLQPDDLSYRQLEKRTGFVKTRRGVVIEVDPASPRKPLSDEEAYRRAMKMDPEAHLGRDPQDRSYVTDGLGSPKRGRKRQGKSAGKNSGKGPAQKRGGRGSSRNRNERGQSRSARSRGAQRQDAPKESRDRSNNGQRQQAQPTRADVPALEVQPRHQGQAEKREIDERKRVAVAPARPERERVRANGENAEAARAGIDNLVHLAGLDLTAEVYEGDERLEIELTGEDERRVTRKRGEVLTSLQQLLPGLVRSRTGERIFCRVDCDRFHEIREERLRDLAQRVAGKVERNQRPQVLESMPPDERRIVHITLTDDPSVSTESLGSGYFKRIRVVPVR